MWASLETWQLGDGSVGELRVGDLLPRTGIRANCARLDLTPASTAAGATLLETDIAGTPRYRLSGVCRVAQAPQMALIEFAGMSVVAEPADFRPAPKSRDPGGVKRHSPRVHLPQPGQMVEADCWLEIVADYEWEALGLPDTRRDWRVSGIRLLQHELVPADDQGEGVVTRGAVASVESQPQLQRAADLHLGHRYLVDVTLP